MVRLSVKLLSFCDYPYVVSVPLFFKHSARLNSLCSVTVNMLFPWLFLNSQWGFSFFCDYQYVLVSFFHAALCLQKPQHMTYWEWGDRVLIRSPYLQTAKTEETISHRPNNNVKVVGTSPVWSNLCTPLAVWVQKVILKVPSTLSQVYAIILKDPSALSQVYSTSCVGPKSHFERPIHSVSSVCHHFERPIRFVSGVFH